MDTTWLGYFPQLHVIQTFIICGSPTNIADINLLSFGATNIHVGYAYFCKFVVDIREDAFRILCFQNVQI